MVFRTCAKFYNTHGTYDTGVENNINTYNLPKNIVALSAVWGTACANIAAAVKVPSTHTYSLAPYLPALMECHLPTDKTALLITTELKPDIRSANKNNNLLSISTKQTVAGSNPR